MKEVNINPLVDIVEQEIGKHCGATGENKSFYRIEPSPTGISLKQQSCTMTRIDNEIGKVEFVFPYMHVLVEEIYENKRELLKGIARGVDALGHDVIYVRAVRGTAYATEHEEGWRD